MSEQSNRRPETGAFFARDRAWHAPAYTPTYKTSVLRSPQRALLSLDGTLSETTGPVFGHSLLGALDNDLIHNYARPARAPLANASSSMAGCWTSVRGRWPVRWWNSGRRMRAGATATKGNLSRRHRSQFRRLRARHYR